MSFCTECGSKLENSYIYCTKCGKQKGVANNNTSLKKLKKLYIVTGNISIIFGIIGFIAGMVVGFEYKDILTDAIVAFTINVPRIYFGKKLKDDKLKNLNYPLKVSLGMFIYSLIYTGFNLILGTGWFYLVLVYFYFKSYRETKIIIISTLKE